MDDYNIFESLLCLWMIYLQALSHSVRDRLIERWHDTHQHFKKQDPKRLYFLSLEFLMGTFFLKTTTSLYVSFCVSRQICIYFLIHEFCPLGRSLSNSVINLGIQDEYSEALSQLGFEFEVLAEQVCKFYDGR